jgi:protein-tyrosine phosphatase
MGQGERLSDEKLKSVLFVCTANIFRSVTAEYALKIKLGAHRSCIVSSAGIDAKPQPMHTWVQGRLREKGADPTTHVQRQLTRELVEAADLVLAMGRDHQAYIREQFGRDVPLFNQVCLGHDKPVLDLHEVMPEWERDPERARAYVWSVIDMIWATAPALLPRLR